MVQRRPGINLARPVDAGRGFHDLLVIGDPARHAADGEHHREHLHRDADRAHDDAAVEVHVRIQLALDEVGIAQGRFLQVLGNVQQRVADMELGQHVVAGLLDDLGARVVILIDPVAEAHQPLAAVLVLGRGDELRAVVARLVNLLEHFQHRLVGAAVQRTPQRANPGRRAGEQIRPARRHHAHRRRRAVLLVVGVQQEDQVQRFDRLGLQVIILVRQREHHVQEVRRVLQFGLRVNGRQPARFAIRRTPQSSAPWTAGARPAPRSCPASGPSTAPGWKQLVALIIAERMAIGWAWGGKPSKWYFMASFSSSFSVSRSEKRRSSALVGSLPMMIRWATSMNVDFSASSSIGMPR